MLFKSSIFFPLFTLLSFVLTYPYFRKYGSSFFRTCLIIGVLYDIAYTDSIFVHAFLFCILGFFIPFLYHFFDKNFWTLLLMSLIVIIVYQMLHYGLFLLSGKVILSISIFTNSILYSVISNIIYVLILYGMLWLLRKYKLVEFYH